MPPAKLCDSSGLGNLMPGPAMLPSGEIKDESIDLVSSSFLSLIAMAPDVLPFFVPR